MKVGVAGGGGAPLRGLGRAIGFEEGFAGQCAVLGGFIVGVFDPSLFQNPRYETGSTGITSRSFGSQPFGDILLHCNRDLAGVRFHDPNMASQSAEVKSCWDGCWPNHQQAASGPCESAAPGYYRKYAILQIHGG